MDKCIGCMTLAAFFCGSISSAAMAQPSDLFSLSLEELMQVKITSATRTEESLRTAPSSVSVFTREQISQLGVDYLHEILNYVPGFQAFRQEEASNEYYHSARGHRSSTSSREALILLDGQRLNREFDNATAIPMLPLGNVEKIEFIRGPGSAIYGSNAFLGVISITTLKGVNAVGASSSNHNVQGEALLSAHSGEMNMDLAVHAVDDRGEHFHVQDSATLPAVSHRAARDPRSGQDINLKLGWQDAAINVVHAERTAGDFYVLGKSAGDTNETRNVYSSLQFSNSVHWNEDNQTHYSLRYYEDLYSPESIYPGLAHIDLEQMSRSVAFDFHNAQALSKSQNLLYGMEYRHVHIADSHVDSSVMGELLLTKEHQRDITGIYAQHQWQASKTDTFTSGIRFDNYSQAGGSWSPRLGWIHALNNEQEVKILYGEAFRAPTTNEQSLISILGTTLQGNPDLEPETIKTWEAVWMGNWQRHSLAVTFFHNQLVNGIVRDVTVAPNTFMNASHDEHWQGLELEYIGQLSEAWQWRASYSQFGNLSDADINEADKLASLILNYRQSDWNFNISATQAAGRSMLTPGGLHHIDAHWLLGSKLQFAINRELGIYLQASNLLNADTETPYFIDDFNSGLPDRGRELTVGFNWQFD